MRHLQRYVLIGMFISSCLLSGCNVGNGGMDKQSDPVHSASVSPDNLAVLWTSGDPYVAQKICFMYTHNAKKQNWFGRVQLIIWGPSAKLLAEDASLQDYVKRMMTDGVEVKACKACADSYDVSDDLAALGIEVKYMGRPLTRILKSESWETLTF